MLPYTGMYNIKGIKLSLYNKSKLRSCIKNYEYESFTQTIDTMGDDFFVDILVGYALKKVIKIML